MHLMLSDTKLLTDLLDVPAGIKNVVQNKGGQ
jgi:hypothetical protein